MKYFEPQEGRLFKGGRLLEAGCLFEHLRYIKCHLGHYSMHPFNI